MSQGVGSFWYPHYTQFFLNPFYEHPPLVLWLQSFAYRIFGDHRLVEFLWGTVCALLIIFFIYRLYMLSDQKKTNEQKVVRTAWFPIFLFAVIPTISWTFSNNILENTMAVFTTASVWLIFRAFISGKRICLYSFIAGALIIMAFMSKGLTGLFPLAVPAIFLISYGKFRFKEFKNYIIKPYAAIASSVLLFAVLIYVFKRQEAAAYSFYYFNNQVLKSLSGKNENVRYMYLVYRFLGELIVPVFIAGALYLILKWTKKYLRPVKQDNKFFIAMLLIAASASLPTFISPKQRIWYLFASWPFYSLAIAYYFRNTALSINKIFEKAFLKRTALAFSLLLLVVSIGLILLSSGTKFKRLPEFYSDLISQNVSLTGEQVVISVCPKTMSDSWETLAFMQRYYKASFTPEDNKPFLLADLTSPECLAFKNCIPMNTAPKRFALYRCATSEDVQIDIQVQVKE
jgi:4-amino-4-deoxy-L-arabinose transferase-like glycosyltransferase